MMEHGNCWTRFAVAFVVSAATLSSSSVAAQEQAAPASRRRVPTPAEVASVLAEEALPPRMVTARAAGSKSADAGSDIQALLRDAAQTALALKKADEQYAELTTKVEDFQQRLQRHNTNRCTYPEGHPEQCAEYTREAAALNAERDQLIAAFTANEQERRSLKTRLGLQKARLRVAAALAFDCRCDGLATEAAKACWDACFDRGDPRLRSCLDIADLDSFASCLLRPR